MISGLVYCGKCGNRLKRETRVKGSSRYISYVCRNKRCNLRPIRADELETAACDYARAICASSIRRQMEERLQAYAARKKQERESRIAFERRKVEEYRSFVKRCALKEDLKGVLWRTADELVQMVKEHEKAEDAEDALPCLDAYFCFDMPDDPQQDAYRARRAVERYIERINVTNLNIEFECTFDAWFLREMEELKQRERGKPAIADGFEETEGHQ